MAKFKYYKIINWNANGIKNKLLELEELLNRYQVDVCLVTETKLSAKTDYINVRNYNCF